MNFGLIEATKNDNQSYLYLTDGSNHPLTGKAIDTSTLMANEGLIEVKTASIWEKFAAFIQLLKGSAVLVKTDSKVYVIEKSSIQTYLDNYPGRVYHDQKKVELKTSGIFKVFVEKTTA